MPRQRLIVSQWPNIERILLSLALDNIIRSLYRLDYIDSAALRRNVQRALNRGEAYHQLRRAIAYAHEGRFRARSQHEQEVSNAPVPGSSETRSSTTTA